MWKNLVINLFVHFSCIISIGHCGTRLTINIKFYTNCSNKSVVMNGVWYKCCYDVTNIFVLSLWFNSKTLSHNDIIMSEIESELEIG